MPATTPTTGLPTPPPTGARPRLVRLRDDRVVAGVASGIARHLGLDPVVVRLVFVVLALANGSGVLAYVVAWVVVPEESDGASPPVVHDPDTPRRALGALLVLGGLLMALDLALPAAGRLLWPLALVVLGITILLTGARR